MPEIVQDIGAYAGLASVVGLAVLSALYFSQARDVKRLREWAGRAPERADQGAPVVPGRVVAQPQRTGAPAVPGGPKPGAPAVPGARPGAVPGAPQPAAPAVQGASQPAAPAVPGAPQPAAPAAPGAPKPAAPGGPRPAAPALRGAAAATASARPAAATAAGARPATATAQGPADEASEPESAAADDEGSAGAATATEEPAGASEEAAAGSSAPDKTSAEGPPSAAPAAAAAAGAAASANSKGATHVPAANAGRPAAPPVPGARPPARPGGAGRVVPQQTAIIAPPRGDPWYRRLAANPLYLVLAVAGVLIVGGAAAFGVTELVGDDEGGGTAQGPRQVVEEEPNGGAGDQGEQRRGRGGAGVNPGSVTVAVLNGTTVPGLAATIMDQAEEAGFRAGTVANFLPNQQLGESVVQYTPGHERDAAAVSRRLQIAQREAVNPSSQELAGDATVVVLVGADKAP